MVVSTVVLTLLWAHVVCGVLGDRSTPPSSLPSRPVIVVIIEDPPCLLLGLFSSREVLVFTTQGSLVCYDGEQRAE